MWNGIDKRRFPRANYQCVIRIRRFKDPEAIYTQTENIGVGGICVFLDRSLKLFEEVGLELIIEDSSSAIECMGKVVWEISRKDIKDKKQTFDVGIEFLDLNEKDKARIEIIVEEVLSKNRIVSQ